MLRGTGELCWSVREVGRALDGAALFRALFANEPVAFWLDSSRAVPGLSPASILGTTAGSDAETIVYRVGDGDVFTHLRNRLAARRATNPAGLPDGLPDNLPDGLTDGLPSGFTEGFTGGYVGYFGYELKALTGGAPAHVSPTPDALWIWANRFAVIDPTRNRTWFVAIHPPTDHPAAQAWLDHALTTTTPDPSLDNATDDSTARASDIPAAPHARPDDSTTGASDVPDANQTRPDDSAARASDVQAVPQARPDDGTARAPDVPEALHAGPDDDRTRAFGVRDGATVERTHGGGRGEPGERGGASEGVPEVVGVGIEGRLEVSREGYLAAIGRCREALEAGESYEICLTNRVRLPAVADPLGFYLWQRRRNPAPYAAFLRYHDLAVASSSPERFLTVGTDGWAECRPIKGTAPRSDDPDEDRAAAERLAVDEKTRAENLMIVDLIRNDLGRVCEPGTVLVPRLMKVESYATVHQLVTTVRGRLREDVDVLDAVQACFPPGSMTGAPKIRTMEIIDSLEPSARGVYSGALGYLGLDGRADLSVVIRTAVMTPSETVVGAGGAIVLDSVPSEEYDEMLLKATAAVRGQAG